MKGCKGFTLLEILVSILLTAVMVSSVFSIALTAKRGGGRTDRKMIASQGSRELTAMLRLYVTANPNEANWGPNAGNWTLDSGGINDCGDLGASPPTDCPGTDNCPGCYALEKGSHVLSGFLPGWFEGSPYNARTTYWVSYQYAYSVANGTMPLVNISVDWSEP